MKLIGYMGNIAVYIKENLPENYIQMLSRNGFDIFRIDSETAVHVGKYEDGVFKLTEDKADDNKEQKAN